MRTQCRRQFVLDQGLRPSVGEDSVPVHMVQRAEAVGAQDRRDLGVFFLVENELKSNLICFGPLGGLVFEV
jgi:hypothetical protein